MLLCGTDFHAQNFPKMLAKVGLRKKHEMWDLELGAISSSNIKADHFGDRQCLILLRQFLQFQHIFMHKVPFLTALLKHFQFYFYPSFLETRPSCEAKFCWLTLKLPLSSIFFQHHFFCLFVCWKPLALSSVEFWKKNSMYFASTGKMKG